MLESVGLCGEGVTHTYKDNINVLKKTWNKKYSVIILITTVIWANYEQNCEKTIVTGLTNVKGIG